MHHQCNGPRTLAACCCMLLLTASHAATGREQLQHTLSPAAVLVESAWRGYYQELAAVHVDGRPVMDHLEGFKQYGFTLTPYQLQRGYVNNAKGARLRRLVRRQLLSPGGPPLKIGVIGTSVSWGTGPSERGTTDYVSMLPVALQMAFPQANVTSRNGCSPGTGSGFANMCLAHMLDEDVDLVIMEFVTNDFVVDVLWDNTHAVTYERLIRKALQMKNNPVVMFIQVPTWGQMFNTSRSGHKPWPQSGELLYSSLSQYYGLPTLSFRNAWWHDAEASSPLAPAGWGSMVVPDQVHPNDVGHRSMLDMVMWLMMQTAMDLQISSMSKREAYSIGGPLPAPMHAGNYEEATSLCILEEELSALVDPQRSQGWALVNEGTEVKKKIGYVSTTPGSQLHITLNLGGVLGTTGFDDTRAGGRMTVGVALAYLQSYTHMGQATWTCMEGCTCQERLFDAHHTQQTSTSFMALVPTNATEPLCKIVVRISTNTSSGGHKFKVSAIMVSRMQEMGFHWSTDRSAEWKLVEWLNGEPM